jgi:predicted RNA-binding Zn-ribbon protein involved in translation (DUF1610 family)
MSVRHEAVGMSPSVPPSERQPPDKATLYCPECGHESRINGDWVIHVRAESVTYECPNCDAVIDSRRQRQELADGSDGSLQFADER